MSYSQGGLFTDPDQTTKYHRVSLRELISSKNCRSDVNLSHRETGRDDSSCMERARALSANINLLFVAFMAFQLTGAGQKRGESQRRKYSRKKISPLCLAPVAQYSQLRTAHSSWPRVNVSIRQDETGFLLCESQWMVYILRQIGIVFFLSNRLSVPGVPLTLLSWWLPLSGCLLCTKAPAVRQSYYSIKPSGNGMMCNDVVFYFLSCIIWAHLTSCSS